MRNQDPPYIHHLVVRLELSVDSCVQQSSAISAQWLNDKSVALDFRRSWDRLPADLGESLFFCLHRLCFQDVTILVALTANSLTCNHPLPLLVQTVIEVEKSPHTCSTSIEECLVR